MGNMNWTIIGSLLSGLIGVLIGVWLNRRMELHREKVNSMKILISYITQPYQQERVITLNTIPVVFHKEKEICDLFENYKKIQSECEANLNNPIVCSQKFASLQDSYIKIIEAMAKKLHYSSTVSWDRLKNSYIPKSYSVANGPTYWY